MNAIRQRFGPFIAHISPHASAATEVIQAFMPDPDVVFQRGEAIPTPWAGPDTDKRRVNVAGHALFIKRYNCTGWLYQWKSIFRPSRALRSWYAAIRLRNFAVPTPAPLFCLEERHCGFLGRAYIVFPFFVDGIDLLRLWPQLDAAEQESCLYSLAPVMGHMHAQGVYHGDTNWRNIIVRRQGDQWLFYLIDLDGCRFLKRPSKERALRDLNHFNRDMDRHQVGPLLHKLFFDRWEQAFEINENTVT